MICGCWMKQNICTKLFWSIIDKNHLALLFWGWNIFFIIHSGVVCGQKHTFIEIKLLKTFTQICIDYYLKIDLLFYFRRLKYVLTSFKLLFVIKIMDYSNQTLKHSYWSFIKGAILLKSVWGLHKLLILISSY